MSTNAIVKWITSAFASTASQLFAAGSLDSTFGSGGKVLTDFPGINSAKAAVVQPDGKIVVGGGAIPDIFLLIRYNPDGSRDQSFGTAGQAVTLFSRFGFSHAVAALALQSDGKILAVGGHMNTSPFSNTSDFTVVRYNSDGSLDTSFGSGGVVSTDFGEDDIAHAVAVQPDGKIVVAGARSTSSSNTSAVVVVRYNSDGTPDGNFGSGGTFTANFGGIAQARGISVQPDGKIVAAGSLSGNFLLFRLTSGGTLDGGFGMAGKTTTDFGGTDAAIGVALQSDGQIVAAGASGSDIAVARYNGSDGSPDLNFDADGKATTSGASSNAMKLQADGKIVIVGTAGTGNAANFAITRFNSNGSLDSGFSGTGKVSTDFINEDVGSGIAIQADGRIIAVGTASVSKFVGTQTTRLSYFAAARYNANGSLDSGFGSGGKVVTELLFDTEAASGIALQPDGKIVVAGENYPGARTDLTSPYISSDDVRVARYNADGTLDSSFGKGGRVETDFGSPVGETATALALQPDGKIVVVGRITVSIIPPYSAFLTVRYNADGTLDTNFGTGGKVSDFAQILTFARAVVIQPDGKILVAGSEGANFGLVRYDTNGNRDNSFDSDGKVSTNFGGGGACVATAMVLQPDGKAVVVGRADIGGEVRFALARYNSDGSLDANFGSGGLVSEQVGAAFGVVLERDGKIVVAGHSYDADSAFVLRRYNPNGTLDTSFGSSGTATTDFSTGVDEAFAVALQADGKIVAAGGMDLLANARFALTRYTTGGTLDSSFGSGGKLTLDFGGDEEAAQALAIQPDGRIIVAGFSNQITQDFALARLTFPPPQLLNIATRMRVQTGENVLIGGFIITGADPKKVIIRGIGPSLSSFFTGTLANPTLELFQGNTLLQSNDDWKTDQRTEIEATGIPPANELESAIVRTVPPGAYTAVLRGSGSSSGIGVVEAYDLNQTANSKLANIATRGFVETGNNIMIGGLIVGPADGLNAKVVVRAIGPSLGNFGIAGALQDPTLEFVNANGVVLRSNDNWKLGGQQTELNALNLQPGDDRESALIETVGPGAYTAIVRGSGNTTGVSLVEVYNAP